MLILFFLFKINLKNEYITKILSKLLKNKENNKFGHINHKS